MKLTIPILTVVIGVCIAFLIHAFRFPSRYYSWEDFSHDGEENLGKCMKRSTLKKLDRLVEILGYKPTVTSGARTPDHNEQIGGVAGSAHITCHAVDLALEGVPAEAMKEAALQAGFERIGIYATHIHVDDDPTKPSPAFWYA